MSSHSSKITILPESQRTPSMETCCCCMLPVHLTQSWANWWGHSCSSSTSSPCTPPLLQPWARSHSPCAATDQQPLLQGNRNQAPVPKPLVWLHMIVYAERVHRGQGDAEYRHRKLSPNTAPTDNTMHWAFQESTLQPAQLPSCQPEHQHAHLH